MASMMGAVAFQKGLGATHSCAHALSTCFDTHHGLANALMIEAVMDFYRDAVPERFARLAQAAACQDFVRWLGELKTRIGLPKNLAAIGVQPTEDLYDAAMADGCHLEGPRVCSREDMKSFYQRS